LSALFIIFTRKNVILELAPNCFAVAHNLVIIPLFKSLNFPKKIIILDMTSSNSECTDIDFIDQFIDVDEENYGLEESKKDDKIDNQNAYSFSKNMSNFT
jgi:hypothetical protein